MIQRIIFCGVFSLAFMAANESRAQESSETSNATAAQPTRVLRVGIKEALPFSFRQEDGTWSGISVELWREIASDLGYKYEFVELPLDELIGSVESGQVDVAFGALTITADRERDFDFTHSYFNSGLGIAVSKNSRSGWATITHRFFSSIFMGIVLGLLALLLAVGVLFYLLEHRKNPEQFGNGMLRGIANGIWWAAVTMTTVGYGDRVPRTIVGRLVAVIWMFSAIVIIASFTASVTSTLTLAKLESKVRGPQDLNAVRVLSVKGSTSAEYLTRAGIGFIQRPDLDIGLKDLATGKCDAVVYDAPILRFQCLTEFPGELDVLPTIFEKQDYAFAMPSGSELREPVNQAMLKYLSDPAWPETIVRYLGN